MLVLASRQQPTDSEFKLEAGLSPWRDGHSFVRENPPSFLYLELRLKTLISSEHITNWTYEDLLCFHFFFSFCLHPTCFPVIDTNQGFLLILMHVNCTEQWVSLPYFHTRMLHILIIFILWYPFFLISPHIFTCCSLFPFPSTESIYERKQAMLAFLSLVYFT